MFNLGKENEDDHHSSTEHLDISKIWLLNVIKYGKCRLAKTFCYYTFALREEKITILAPISAEM